MFTEASLDTGVPSRRPEQKTRLEGPLTPEEYAVLAERRMIAQILLSARYVNQHMPSALVAQYRASEASGLAEGEGAERDELKHVLEAERNRLAMNWMLEGGERCFRNSLAS